jgi:hypothetical protein
MNYRFLTLLFTLFILIGCTRSSVTNDIYLIPRDYEGFVYALYNVNGAPEIKNEGEYEVHTISDEGYFVTSTPDMDYGSVTDKYYYVDENGNRTKINLHCIRGMGTGSFQSDEKINIKYTGIEVKKEGCSKDFQLSANGMDSEDVSTILEKVLIEYYGVENTY